MTPYSVRKEILIDASLGRVWQVLTDSELAKEYMFGANVLSEWTIGSEIIFQGEHNGKTYRDKGIIQKCEIEQELEYTYFSSFSGLEDQPENYSIVSYHLSGLDDGSTSLTLSQKNLPSKEAAIHADSGWDHALSQLKAVAER